MTVGELGSIGFLLRPVGVGLVHTSKYVTPLRTFAKQNAPGSCVGVAGSTNHFRAGAQDSTWRRRGGTTP